MELCFNENEKALDKYLILCFVMHMALTGEEFGSIRLLDARRVFLDKLHLSSLSLLYRNNIDKGHAPWKNKQMK